MVRNRTDFTDKQKADIFCRDRATCCFSGANLWLLDSPLRYDAETDWADHIKPASRGGKSEAANGVCACHTFNIKKRNNSSDTSYLFRDGAPTPLYFSVHGVPSKFVTDRLVRLGRLERSDWYLNRMIVGIRIALHLKWSPEDEHVRQESHWLGAAFKKLLIFRKAQQAEYYSTIEQRRLIEKPSETQRLLLSLRSCDSHDKFSKVVLKLYPEYKINSDIWWSYFFPDGHDDPNEKRKCDRRRHKIYEKAFSSRDRLTFDTFDCIQSDYSIRFPQT